MSAREKIAYLKGLIDGQGLEEEDSKKAGFYVALVDALDSLAEAIEGHEAVHVQLNDYLEQLDEDVCDMEETLDAVFEDECDGFGYDDDFDEEYDSVECPHCGKDFYYEPAAYDDDEELLCPHCGRSFTQPEEEEED